MTEQVMHLPAALPTAARSAYGAFRSIQRKTSDESPEGAGGEGAALVNDVICSSGRPLDPATRKFFEPRFGYDFSRVRVHADDRAAESASAVNARAYTISEHVVFGGEQFSPNSIEGRSLLAKDELTHVIQQGGSTFHSCSER